MREPIIVINANLSHQNIVAVIGIGLTFWSSLTFLPAWTAVLSVLRRAVLAEHAEAVDIEALLEDLLDLLRLMPFLFLDLRHAHAWLQHWRVTRVVIVVSGQIDHIGVAILLFFILYDGISVWSICIVTAIRLAR